jgi:anti-sigma B factor antagonist
MHWTEISERRDDDIVILDLRGHLTLADEDKRLTPKIASLLDEGCRGLLLNLRHLGFIDSQGIGEIVGAYTRMARLGGRLVLCEASPRIRDVLQATNLDTVLETFETEEQAIGALHAVDP